MAAKRIALKVGEHAFESTESTLFKSPVLKMLIKRDQLTNEVSEIFIDRPGAPFLHILNWMRVGHFARQLTTDEYREILEEADYYGLTELVEWMSNRSNLYNKICVEDLSGEKVVLDVCELRKVKHELGGVMADFLNGHDMYARDGNLLLARKLETPVKEVLAKSSFTTTWYIGINMNKGDRGDSRGPINDITNDLTWLFGDVYATSFSVMEGRRESFVRYGIAHTVKKPPC